MSRWWLILLLVVAGGGAAAWWLASRDAERRADAERTGEVDNLNLISWGLHGFHERYGRFPMAVGTRGRDGRPGLSWRVLILPFMEEGDLYARFKLDEPWDGPNNLPLLAHMPAAFGHPAVAPGEGLTRYQGVRGAGCVFDEAFPGTRGMKVQGGVIRLGKGLSDLRPDTGRVALLVTAANAVPWTKPADFEAWEGDIPSRLDVRFRGRYRGQKETFVAMADGGVHGMTRGANTSWRALFTHDEGDLPE